MIDVIFSLLILISVTGQPNENCAHCLDKKFIENLICYDRAVEELCWDICESLPDFLDEITTQLQAEK